MAGASGRGDPLALEEPSPPRPAPQENCLGDPHRLAQIHFKILRGHTDIVSSCHFCFEDTKILSCSYDKTVKLWDVEKSVPVQVFEEEHVAPISECSLTPDNKRVITSSYDKTVKAWDMETGKMLWTVDQEGLVTSCDISCDGKYVVSGLDMENAICVIDAVNAITVAYVQAFSFGSNLIIDTAVQQVHQHIFKDLILRYAEHFQFPLMPVGAEDAQLNMVSASTNAYLMIGNIYKEDCFTVCHKDHHRSTVTRCCFDPDNERVCSVSCDKTIKLWDIIAQSTTITIDEAHNNVISDCCFSIDGHYLCTASWDKILKIWDVKIGEFRCHGPICLNQGHKGSVSSCIFSKDASLVVSGAYDKTIALWDAGAGYKKLALKDATLRLWNIEKADHVPEAIGNRNTRDSKIVQCEECEKPFSLLQCDDSEAVTKCVFCRLASPSRNILPLPPTIAPDL